MAQASWKDVPGEVKACILGTSSLTCNDVISYCSTSRTVCNWPELLEQWYQEFVPINDIARTDFIARCGKENLIPRLWHTMVQLFLEPSFVSGVFRDWRGGLNKVDTTSIEINQQQRRFAG